MWKRWTNCFEVFASRGGATRAIPRSEPFVPLERHFARAKPSLLPGNRFFTETDATFPSLDRCARHVKCYYVGVMSRSKWLRRLLVGMCALPVAGTLLSLSRRRTHWFFRVWDFPRVQIAAVAAVGGTSYALRFFRGSAADFAVLLPTTAVLAWQCYRIRTYTPLVSPTVLRVRPEEADAENRITLMMTNVLMENDQHARLVAAVEQANPDVVLAVEIDDRWHAALEPLFVRYPYAVRCPQNNYYGMVLLSRFPLVEPRVEYLVQDDIPSIHTGVRLKSGVQVTLHGLHPRPPEPLRDQPSSPRDAELVVVGRMIGDDKDTPTIVAGDLNDVAWSPTSELFVRLSGLLDPRAGRGFYNSYNAKSRLFRYPLDHVFHSKHFKLVRIERCPSVGSDHFPILIELQYVPTAASEQEGSKKRPGDEEIADEKLEQEAEDAATGADRPRE
jgi:endonuclease/exonuclease/phosphatase (EEP) superfamily protein YafD